MHDELEPFSVDVHDLDTLIFFQQFAQLGNVDVHGTAVEVIVVAPDGAQGGLSVEHIVAGFAEQVQQLSFFGRELFLLFFQMQDARNRFVADASDLLCFFVFVFFFTAAFGFKIFGLPL